MLFERNLKDSNVGSPLVELVMFLMHRVTHADISSWLTFDDDRNFFLAH